MAKRSASSDELSFKEFEQRYAGKRYEYVHGRAEPMGPEEVVAHGERIVALDAAQGLVITELASMIARHVEERFLGTTFMDVGFWLSQDPPELRGADVGFISRKRLARSRIPDDWLPLPPDLVVRIGEHDINTAERVPVHAEDGPFLLWVVYPTERAIEVHRPGALTERLCEGDTLDGGDVLPGFSVEVEEIFAPLEALQ